MEYYGDQDPYNAGVCFLYLYGEVGSNPTDGSNTDSARDRYVYIRPPPVPPVVVAVVAAFPGVTKSEYSAGWPGSCAVSKNTEQDYTAFGLAFTGYNYAAYSNGGTGITEEQCKAWCDGTPSLCVGYTYRKPNKCWGEGEFMGWKGTNHWQSCNPTYGWCKAIPCAAQSSYVKGVGQMDSSVCTYHMVKNADSDTSKIPEPAYSGSTLYLEKRNGSASSADNQVPGLAAVCSGYNLKGIVKPGDWTVLRDKNNGYIKTECSRLWCHPRKGPGVCPVGFEQVGAFGGKIDGCGLMPSGMSIRPWIRDNGGWKDNWPNGRGRFAWLAAKEDADPCDLIKMLVDKEQCGNRCTETAACIAFTWNDEGNVCKLYDSDVPTSTLGGAQQRFCKKAAPASRRRRLASATRRRLGDGDGNGKNIACADCDKGSIAAAAGTSVCSDCVVGAIQPEDGKSGCVDCAAGKFVGIPAQTACDDCAVGTFAPSAKTSACPVCVVGKVQPEKGKLACVDCAPGKVQGQTEQTECVDCLTGTIAATAGLGGCTKCATGMFQEEEGKTECAECLSGTVAPATGTTTCTNCARGKFQEKKGQLVCATCPKDNADTPVQWGGLPTGRVPRLKISGWKTGMRNLQQAALTSWDDTGGKDTSTKDRPWAVGDANPGPGGENAYESVEACARWCQEMEEEHETKGYKHGCGAFMYLPADGSTGYRMCKLYGFAVDAGPGDDARKRTTWVRPADRRLQAAASTEAPAASTEAPAASTAAPAVTKEAETYDGSYTDQSGSTLCATWTDCPAGFRVGFVGSVTADRTCVNCEPETWNVEENVAKCTPWTICEAPGGKVTTDGKVTTAGKVETGVTTAGTPVNDVVCTACGKNSVSLIDDALSVCFDLPDSDGDGLLDRFGYTDQRQLGARNQVLDRVRYNPLTDQDPREGPDGGGKYDDCPYDPLNDVDGDGICAIATTPAIAAAERKGQYRKQIEVSTGSIYADGLARQDLCPNDPKNDEDMDGICDNKDKDVTAYAFNSYNLVGWRDETCRSGTNCPQPDGAFKVLALNGRISKDDQADFKYDERVRAVCEINDQAANAVFDIPAGSGQTCDDICASTNMECKAAAVIEHGVQASRRLLSRDIDGDGDADTGGCKIDTDKKFCDASADAIKCECTFDSKPVKVIEWSQRQDCPTCFASTAHKDAATGSMNTDIKIKKNTMTFYVAGGPVGAEGAERFVRLTIKNKDASLGLKKALKGMPSITHTVSGFDETSWYPVEWDVSAYMGETAVLEVADRDMAGSISIDEIENMNTASGCLPTCMEIDHDNCAGKQCFRFEKDPVPYLEVKKTGGSSGVYCRDSPVGETGSMIGPGISKMGRFKDGQYDVFVLDKIVPELLKIEAAAYTRGDCVEFKGEGDFANKACVTERMSEKGAVTLEIQDGMDGAKRDGKTRALTLKSLGPGKGYKSDGGLRVKNLALTTGCGKVGLECAARFPEGYYGEGNPKNSKQGIMDYAWVKANLGFEQPEDEWVPVTRQGLGAIDHLPRCLAIDFRGSHLAISTSEEEMGADGPAREFAFQLTPELDGMKTKAHCIYPTFKPVCEDFSKPSSAFRKMKKVTCKVEVYKASCMDTCYQVNCNDTGKACGVERRVQQCFTCCKNNKNVASGCFRRRRRLREAATETGAITELPEATALELGQFTRSECASTCLRTPRCTGWDSNNGACSLATDCDGAMGEDPAYRKGTWNVLRTETDESLGLKTPQLIMKKRKVKSA